MFAKGNEQKETHRDSCLLAKTSVEECVWLTKKVLSLFLKLSLKFNKKSQKKINYENRFGKLVK